MNRLAPLAHATRRPAAGAVLLSLIGLALATTAALPAVGLAAALLLGRLPRAALAVTAVAFLAATAGLTVTASDRPAHLPRVAAHR